MKIHLSLSVGGLLLGFSVLGSANQGLPGPGVGERFDHPLQAEDQHGQLRSLDELMGDKGLVIVFVRSADWCPFCKAQLIDVNSRMPEFSELGLNVISISVDEVPEVSTFADAQQIEYTMLADPQGDINEALGIRDEQYPVGSAAFGVPRPALYVVDRNAVVRASYMEPTYRTRPDLDTVLKDAAALGL